MHTCIPRHCYLRFRGDVKHLDESQPGSGQFLPTSSPTALQLHPKHLANSKYNQYCIYLY